VRPGDLLHGDQHGVIDVSLEIAGRIAEGEEKVEAVERQIISFCQSPGFSRRGLEDLFKTLR